MDDRECVAFLHWCLPRLGLRKQSNGSLTANTSRYGIRMNARLKQNFV